MNETTTAGAASLGRTHVIVAVAEPDASASLRAALRDEPCEVLSTRRAERALGWLGEWDVSLVVTGGLPPAEAEALTQAVRGRSRGTRFLSIDAGIPDEAAFRRSVRGLLAEREREDEQVMIDLAASGWSPLRPSAPAETGTQVLEKPAPPAAPPALKPLVVAVDDEPSILAALARVLRREPLELRTTQDPDEALRWVREHNVGVLIADQRMPSRSGLDLLDDVRRTSPATARILLTGYPDPSLLKACDQNGARRLITKPWDDNDLRRAVRDLLRRREAS